MVEASDDVWRQLGRVWLSDEGARNEIGWVEYRVSLEAPYAHPIPDMEASADAHH